MLKKLDFGEIVYFSNLTLYLFYASSYKMNLKKFRCLSLDGIDPKLTDSCMAVWVFCYNKLLYGFFSSPLYAMCTIKDISSQQQIILQKILVVTVICVGCILDWPPLFGTCRFVFWQNFRRTVRLVGTLRKNEPYVQNVNKNSK